MDPDIPLFGFIGRLEEQKGVDILVEALSQVGPQGGVQAVVLGTGKKVLEAAVLKLDQQFPDTVKGVVKFDVPLAHLMTAGRTKPQNTHLDIIALITTSQLSGTKFKSAFQPFCSLCVGSQPRLTSRKR